MAVEGGYSQTSMDYAKAFGGADGFGGDGHDRQKLQSAGLSYETGGPTSIQDVLGAAGNVNQFHISEDGQEQTKKIFALAEAEGMLEDGNLSNDELTSLKGMIEDPTTATTPQGKELAQAINAEAKNADQWEGSPQGPHSPSSMKDAAEAMLAFDFFDWLMDALGMSEEDLEAAWQTPEGKEEVMGALKEKLDSTDMSEEQKQEVMDAFETEMDNGNTKGAASLVNDAMQAQGTAMDADADFAADIETMVNPDQQPEGI